MEIDVNDRFPELVVTIEDKVLRICRGKIEYTEYDFGEEKCRANRETGNTNKKVKKW